MLLDWYIFVTYKFLFPAFNSFFSFSGENNHAADFVW